MKHPVLYTLIVLTFIIGLVFWSFGFVNFSNSEWLQITSLFLVLAYLLVAFFRKDVKFSKSLKYLAVWVTIGLMIVYGYQFDFGSFSNGLLAQIYPARGQVLKAGEVTFARAYDGQFYVDAVIDNSAPIRFMVDTGASSVVLTARDAERLGVNLDSLHYTAPSSTANGMIWTAPVMLSSITIHGLTVYNVIATVSSSNLGVSLLGMTFLEKLKEFRFKQGDLTLVY